MADAALAMLDVDPIGFDVKLCPSYGVGEVDKIKARRLLKTEADFR